MKTVNVKANNDYNIFIENGIFNNIDEYIKDYDRVFLIVDNKVELNGLSNKIDDIFYLEVKEENKNSYVLSEILNFFKENNIKRKSDLVVAVGGGVTLDITGFACSLYKRGIDMCFVPTTLLSQVDASVGSKNAIHYKGQKNVLGTFYDPKFVLIDPLFLKTLDKVQIKSGLAEIIKISFLLDKNMLILLSSYQEQSYDWEKIIYKAVSYKALIVKEDMYDKSVRKILNFGHTFGHAIEAYYDYDKYTHGEAISIGMALSTLDKKVIKVLKLFGLPLHLDDDMDFEKLYSLMLEDKKNIDKNIQIITLRNIEKPDFEYLDNYIQIKLRNEKVKLIENEINKK